MDKKQDMPKEVQKIKNKSRWSQLKIWKKESSVCKLRAIKIKNLTYLRSLCTLHNFNLAPY